jgi:hypothetical protein
VAKKKDKDKPVAVGDRVQVNLHNGKLEEGIVKAIITRTDGLHYQIDLGGDRTALIHERQIRKE